MFGVELVNERVFPAVFQRHPVVTCNITVWGKDHLEPKLSPFGEVQFLIYF